jgi:hypothetical protein
LALFSGLAALAQDTATLSVTVVDPSSAVVPGAKVTITDLGRGTVRQAETKDAGFVIFDFLQPGTYSLEATKAGFDTYRVDSLNLQVRDRQTFRVEFRVTAAAGTKVEVMAAAEAPSSDVGQAVSLGQQFLQYLPVNGWNAESLILMSPGITTAAGGRSDGGFNANGLRSNTNYFTLDGVSLNQPTSTDVGFGGARGGFGGGAGAGAGSTELISIDAMQEMKVQASAFAPEFGRSPGAQIVMTSRSGGNGLHGSLFYYARNDRFDANDWFANEGGYPRGAEQENRPGGTLGGPIVKNHTFFFVSYEKLKLLAPESVISDVPNLATRLSVAPNLQPFLNAFPIPTGIDLGSGSAEYRAVLSNPSNSNFTTVRVDHILSPKTNLFLRFSLTPSSSNERGTQESTPNLVTVRSSHAELFTAGMTNVLSDGALNDLRLNYSRTSTSGQTTMDNFGGAVPLTNSLVFPKGVTSETGSFDLSILGYAGYSFGGHTSNDQGQVNVVDSLTRVSGNHSLKAGVDYRELLQTTTRVPYSVGVSFDGLTTGDYAFQNNVALNGQITSNLPTVYPTYTNFSLYGQDTWRATDRTTITYGLRWDVNPAPTTREGPKPFALSSSNIAGVTQNDPIYPTRWFDVAPRLGIAYLSDDTPGHEMMLRAGIGLFYDLGYGAIDSAFSAAPYSNVQTVSGVNFPFTAADLVPPVLPPIRPYGEVTTGDSALKSPVVLQWNGTWEKSFGAGNIVSIGIVGTRGYRLMRMATEPSYTAAYDVLRLLSNGSSSAYNSAQIQYHKRLSRSFQAQFSYTWARSVDSSSTDSGFGGGFASLYGNGEHGPSDYDVRNNLSFSGSWRLPAPRGLAFYPLRHWYLDFVAAARSGLPFDIQGVSAATSGSAGAGLFAEVRPNIVAGQPIWIDDPKVPGGKRLNFAAFSPPVGYAQGDLGRNALRGFGFAQLDLSLRRMIPITERYQIGIAAEGYNILNHPNFANPSPLEGANMSSPNFGIVTQMMNQAFGGGVNPLFRSGGSRSMELSLRLQF